MKVLVIGGGISDEREISLKSSRAVFDAIGDNHHKEFYDWNGSEDWLREQYSRFDVVLPVLHGPGGEDGQIQALLEKFGLKYLGSGVEASKLCMDKVRTQSKLSESGILVPKQATVNLDTYYEAALSQVPHVLKPISGGSSLDTFLLRNGRITQDQAQLVFAKYQEMLIEELIEGDEVTVPVLDGYDLPLIQIIPPDGVFFDYENKYNGATKEICHPDNISEEVQKNAVKLAQQCHKVTGCKDISRVDIIITQEGKMYVLEINTIPGLTNQSLFPKAANYIGMSMEELVEYFIELASR